MFYSSSVRFVTCVCDETAGWEQRGGEASSTSERQADECKDAEHDGRLRESGQRVSGCGGVGGGGSGGLAQPLQACLHESQLEPFILIWVCFEQDRDVLLIVPAAAGR